MASNIIWIDPNIDNEQNTKYAEEINSMNSFKLKLFKEVEPAINYIKDIKFEETKVIVSGRPYSEFVNKFKENLTKIYVTPKIIVFTSTKNGFLFYNKGYNDADNSFYNQFEKIKDFLKRKEIINKENDSNYEFQLLKELNLKNDYDPLIANYESEKLKNSDEFRLTFEYIDSKEKLLLPLFFKALIENISHDKIEKYTNLLYNTYSNKNNEIKKLLSILISIPDIPIEILSKYYARLFTIESAFYQNLNRDLSLNKLEKYLRYIKILYEGVKLKSLPLASSNILYRGAKISNAEVNMLKNYIKKKKEGLPGSIAF